MVPAKLHTDPGLDKVDPDVNDTAKKTLPDWLPFIVGLALIVQFAGLGIWQVERGLGKRAEQALLASDPGFTPWTDGMSVRPYQRLSATGKPIDSRQFLLDNIIIDNRLGYYVLLPIETAEDEPLLLVNRGWIGKTGREIDPPDIDLNADSVTLRGRVGSLPKGGYRVRDAMSAADSWPRRAVYPTSAELAAALGRNIQDFVLLLDPQEEHGFLRYWVPEEMGAGRHFAYALQWFAIAAVLALLLVWNYRRRWQRHRANPDR